MLAVEILSSGSNFECMSDWFDLPVPFWAERLGLEILVLMGEDLLVCIPT